MKGRRDGNDAEHGSQAPESETEGQVEYHKVSEGPFYIAGQAPSDLALVLGHGQMAEAFPGSSVRRPLPWGLAFSRSYFSSSLHLPLIMANLVPHLLKGKLGRREVA